jgi:4-diphosphocytidyl-2-C-methyl-D-erythritol kinase
LLAGEEGNLVLDALALLPHGTGWAVALDKALPVAAGLGGGSADCGAVFRLVRRLHGLPDGWQALAARLGPMCPPVWKAWPCWGAAPAPNSPRRRRICKAARCCW